MRLWNILTLTAMGAQEVVAVVVGKASTMTEEYSFGVPDASTLLTTTS